jgi:hypothetical protein
MNEMEEVRGKDDTIDILIDSVMELRTLVLIEIQHNVEEYVEGACKNLSGKLKNHVK